MTGFEAQPDPFALFGQWFAEAKKLLGNEDGSAMCVATSTPDGKPSARILLLKNFDERGFVFYSNTTSRKGQELAANPHAALCLYWIPLDKQVRIEGRVEHATAEEADAYFNSRHPNSRRGAWASDQSKPLANREVLMARAEEIKRKYPDDDNIPRPPQWIGYRLVPDAIEFWQEGAHRLHTRVRYTRSKGGAWIHSLLNP
jgi:pyridoxamine 5'-phosphate oxidase